MPATTAISSTSPQFSRSNFSGTVSGSRSVLRKGWSAISTLPRRRLRHGERLVRRAPRRVAALHLAQHVAADRRRHRRAAAAGGAAMLDHRGADIPRGVDRRERDEQRVIALLPWQVSVAPHAPIALGGADMPDLRGAGLAAHRHAGI